MKIVEISISNTIHRLYVSRASYRGGDLAITVECDYFDEELGIRCREPFGTLTVNLVPYSSKAATFVHAKPGLAFVKNWAENEEWAEALAIAIGGKPTGVSVLSGYVSVPLWDFSEVEF